jgi:hypothetical protein
MDTESKISSVDWRPVVWDYMTDVSTMYAYAPLIQNNFDLYSRIKAQETKLDSMRAAPINEIIPILREWRSLVLQVQFQQTANKEVKNNANHKSSRSEKSHRLMAASMGRGRK